MDPRHDGPNYVFAYIQNAFVPTTAPFGSKEVLDIQNVTAPIGSTAFGLGGAAGVHVVGYFGDVSGTVSKSAQDATLIAQVAVGLGGIGTDYARRFCRVQERRSRHPGRRRRQRHGQCQDATDGGPVGGGPAGQTSCPISSLPPSPALGGPDPRLYLPQITAAPGQTVTVALRLDAVENFTLTSADIALPVRRQRVPHLQRAAVVERDGFAVSPNIDNVNGTLKAVDLHRRSGPELRAGRGHSLPAVRRDGGEECRRRGRRR